MQEIEYDKCGGPELMRLEEVEPPMPGKGVVRAASHGPLLRSG